MNDLNKIQALTENSMVSHLGIQILSISGTEVEGVMPVDQYTIQPFGLLHGGASVALGETLAAIGSLGICEPDEICLGIQISANHISSAKMGDRVFAKACLLQRGSNIHVWNVDISSERTQKLVSSIRVTNAIRKKPNGETKNV